MDRLFFCFFYSHSRVSYYLFFSKIILWVLRLYMCPCKVFWSTRTVTVTGRINIILIFFQNSFVLINNFFSLFSPFETRCAIRRFPVPTTKKTWKRSLRHLRRRQTPRKPENYTSSPGRYEKLFFVLLLFSYLAVRPAALR